MRNSYRLIAGFDLKHATIRPEHCRSARRHLQTEARDARRRFYRLGASVRTEVQKSHLSGRNRDSARCIWSEFFLDQRQIMDCCSPFGVLHSGSLSVDLNRLPQ